MFKPNNADLEREEEKVFVQNALRKRFQGDQRLLFQDFPAFMEHPSLRELMERYKDLQDAVHTAFLAAGFGAAEVEPEIALESADPDLTAPPVEEVMVEDRPLGLELEEEASEGNPVAEEPLAEDETPVDDAPQADPPVASEDSETPTHEDIATPAEEAEPRSFESGSEPDMPSAETDSTPADDVDSEAPSTPDNDPPAPMEEKAPIDPPVLPVKLNLPNGKTGVEYIQKIDITPLHRKVASIHSYDSTGFADIGLSFEIDGELVISGSPSDHGKFPVTILLRFEADGDRPAQDYRLQGEIDILPDPRKMWKEIEPDATLPYQKPHLRNDLLHMAGRTMIAASRRGRSHAHSGTFRDDEFELAVSEPQSWYIMAVADGAGSAPYSRRGSQIAVQRAVEVLQTKLDEKLVADLEALAGAWTRNPTDQLRGQIRSRIYEALSHAAYAGYKSICAEAESLGEAPKAFHTTLMITIIRQFDFGCFVGTWWVGDGAVAVLHQGKYLKLMGVSDGGEFAGQTRFLTMPEIWADGATVMKRIEFDVVVEPTAVILMTDGVSDPKFHTDHNLLQQENWDKFWEELSETVLFDHDNLAAPDQLLEWLDFWAPGEHDDRTIAIFF